MIKLGWVPASLHSRDHFPLSNVVWGQLDAGVDHGLGQSEKPVQNGR